MYNSLSRLRDGDDFRPILDKYCVQDHKKEAKMVSLEFELDSDSDPKQIYTAFAREVKHGEFQLKVVHYKSRGPARYDIVLPGR